MSEQDQLLSILLAGFVVVGIVATIAYYFARYVMGEPEGKLHSDELAKTETVESSPQEPSLREARPEPEVHTSLEQALRATKSSLWGRIRTLLGDKSLSPEILDEVEEILFTSDLGVPTVQRLLSAIEGQLKGHDKADPEKVRAALKAEMQGILGARPPAATLLEELQVADEARPQVWLIVGVNGAGKTTTIGKLAHELAHSGQKVLVAAGDTFRAAAGEQLKVWSERAQVEIFSPEGVTDPGAVAYQACERARAQGFDIVLVDTAGRLHTQKNLMEELKKVKRVMSKVIPEAPHLTLLVLDANSGQNAVVQAREFHSSLEVDGVVLTKMDGTAKGGVALALATELKLPVRLIGVGEKIGDLRPFSTQEYIDSII